MPRAVIALLLVLIYQVASARAEIEEADDAVDELSSRMRAARSLGPGEWAALIGAGAAGAALIASPIVQRRGKAGGQLASPPSDPPEREVPRDPALAARRLESDRVAPRWAFERVVDADQRVVLELRNVGAGGAHRVRALGLAGGGGVAPVETAAGPAQGATIPPGGTLAIALAGHPMRSAFHFSYADDLGFVWWCLVEYRQRTAPPVTLGRPERDA